MRYLGLGLLLVLFLLFPWLAYRFVADSRNGIEADEYQRRRSRGGLTGATIPRHLRSRTNSIVDVP